MKITRRNVIKRYLEAKSSIDFSARDVNFREFGRQALGFATIPVAEGIPEVSEGTICTIVHEIPLMTLPDAPVCKVRCEDRVIKLLTEFYINKIVIPKINQEAPFSAKAHMWAREACTYGLQLAEVSFKADEKEGFLPDFKLPYPGFCYIDPDAPTAFDANYIFIEQYYSESDIDHLIDQEKKRTGKPIFNTGRLQRAKKFKRGRTDTNESFVEEEFNSFHGLGEKVLIVKAIARDRLADKKSTKIYYFVPYEGKDNDAVGIVGEEELDDYYGEMPVVPLYFRMFKGKPYGMGIPELLNDLQNAVDELLAYGLRGFVQDAAPMIHASDIEQEDILVEPLSLIFSRSGVGKPTLEPISLSTDTLQNLQQHLAFIRQMMYTKIGAQDSGQTIPYGATTDSKTPQGVQAKQDKLGLILKHYRNAIEHAYGQLFRLWIYSLYHHKNEIEDVEVDQETFSELQKALAVQDLKRLKIKKDSKRLVVEVDWSKFNRELLDEVYMDFNPEFLADFRDQAEQLLKLYPLLNQDAEMVRVLNRKGVIKAILKGLKVDTSKILYTEEEAEQLTLLFNDAVVERCKDIAQEEVGRQVTYAQLRPSDLDTPTIKQMVKKIIGVESTGELARDKELWMEQQQIENTSQQIANTHKENMLKLQIEAREKGVKLPDDTPPAPATPPPAEEVKQAETPNPQKDAELADLESRLAEFIKPLKALGLKPEELEHLSGLYTQMLLAKSKPERTQIALQLTKALDKAKKGKEKK